MDGRANPLMDRKVVGVSGYLSIYLSVYLSICLSIYLYIIATRRKMQKGFNYQQFGGCFKTCLSFWGIAFVLARITAKRLEDAEGGDQTGRPRTDLFSFREVGGFTYKNCSSTMQVEHLKHHF